MFHLKMKSVSDVQTIASKLRNVWRSFRQVNGEPAELAGLYRDGADPETMELVPTTPRSHIAQTRISCCR